MTFTMAISQCGLSTTRVLKMWFILQLLAAFVTCTQFVFASNDTVSDGVRIGVIGAGAGGSSFSYYLQRYTSHRYNITVFESNGYIGGRSTTVGNYARSLGNVTDETLLNSNIELGGSVFVEQNYIMVNAVEVFNLSLSEGSPVEDNPGIFPGSMGIWDGTSFLLWLEGTSTIASAINNVKMIIRYNYTLYKLMIDLQNTVSKFLFGFYTNEFPFDLRTIVSNAGLSELVNSTAREYLTEQNYGQKFLDEMAEAATRVNYRSNLDDIHTFGAFISLAASGAGSVAGGNYQIFESFLDYSEADVLLDTRVSKLEKNEEDNTWNVYYGSVDGDDEQVMTFDQVIIAAPFQFTGIEVSGANVSLNSVEYRKLYASYFQTSSEHTLDNEQFGSSGGPNMMLTSGSDAGFFSCNLVGYDNETDVVTYKVFTEEGISESWLTEQLFANATGVNVWFQKEWYPYPKLVATNEFDGFDVAPGLWYLNGMERFVSTMETSALAGASVAGHIAKGFNTESISVP